MAQGPKRVVLITGHYLTSKRRAGFHWLADAYHRAGWEVLFFSGHFSLLSRIRRLDHRVRTPALMERNRLIEVKPRLWSYVWYTPYHPANLLRIGWLNRLSAPLFRRYGRQPLGPAEAFLKGADLLIFESTPSLLLFDRFKRINPTARYVYRVSDDLRFLREHPVILEAEARLAPRFDLISTTSAFIQRNFQHLPNAELHPHGIRKDLFDAQQPNPYASHPRRNAIFVGVSDFDYDFLERALRLFPQWLFHIIGPLPDMPKAPNIRTYGEMAFEQTVPYIQHADLGLLNRSYSPGAESLTDTLKVQQYTYCRLAMVAPEFLRTPRPHVFYYKPGDEESIRNALEAAMSYDRSKISRGGIRSWDEIAQVLATHTPKQSAMATAGA